MSEHTPEPWVVDFNNTIGSVPVYGVGIEGTTICIAITGKHGAGDDEESKSNARRIVACVNACEGISTEMLEKVKLADVGDIQDALRDCVEALETARTYVESSGWTRHRDDEIAQIEAAIINARKALEES